jgi:hypothetical protein
MSRAVDFTYTVNILEAVRARTGYLTAILSGPPILTLALSSRHVAQRRHPRRSADACSSGGRVSAIGTRTLLQATAAVSANLLSE